MCVRFISKQNDDSQEIEKIHHRMYSKQIFPMFVFLLKNDGGGNNHRRTKKEDDNNRTVSHKRFSI